MDPLKTEVGIVITGSVDSGKCFGVDTEILLYDGSIKKIQNITTNDVLMGPDSKPRTVLETHSGYGKLYSTILGTGITHICNDKHDLCLKFIPNKLFLDETNKLIAVEIIEQIEQIEIIELVNDRPTCKQYTFNNKKDLSQYIEKYNKTYNDPIDIIISVNDYLQLSENERKTLKWFFASVDFNIEIIKQNTFIPKEILYGSKEDKLKYVATYISDTFDETTFNSNNPCTILQFLDKQHQNEFNFILTSLCYYPIMYDNKDTSNDNTSYNIIFNVDLELLKYLKNNIYQYYIRKSFVNNKSHCNFDIKLLDYHKDFTELKELSETRRIETTGKITNVDIIAIATP